MLKNIQFEVDTKGNELARRGSRVRRIASCFLAAAAPLVLATDLYLNKPSNTEPRNVPTTEHTTNQQNEAASTSRYHTYHLDMMILIALLGIGSVALQRRSLQLALSQQNYVTDPAQADLLLQKINGAKERMLEDSKIDAEFEEKHIDTDSIYRDSTLLQLHDNFAYPSNILPIAFMTEEEVEALSPHSRIRAYITRNALMTGFLNKSGHNRIYSFGPFSKKQRYSASEILAELKADNIQLKAKCIEIGISPNIIISETIDHKDITKKVDHLSPPQDGWANTLGVIFIPGLVGLYKTCSAIWRNCAHNRYIDSGNRSMKESEFSGWFAMEEACFKLMLGRDSGRNYYRDLNIAARCEP